MTAIVEPVQFACGAGFQPARRFLIGIVRGLQTRVQDAILPHMTELNHTYRHATLKSWRPLRTSKKLSPQDYARFLEWFRERD